MQNLLSFFFDGVDFNNAFNIAYIFKSIVSRWYLYLALVVLVIVIVLFVVIKKPPIRNKLNVTQRISYVSMFIALCTAVNVLQISTSFAQFSLVASVACLSGVLLGPLDGFTVAFVGDLIAAIIAPLGIYSPIIGLGTGLFGLIPGLIFSYIKLNDNLKVVISYIATFILSSIVLNTIGLSLIYPKVYVMTERIAILPFNLLFHAVNCVLSIGLVKIMKKVLPKNKFFIEKI